jgi:hypothetical protein
LCAALRELDLSTTITDQPEDINWCWLPERCKFAFITEVSKYIPKKKLKSRNPLPWLSYCSNILYQIKKEESIRRKLKVAPTSYLTEK